MTIDAKKCPLCDKNNYCGNELGDPTCWCTTQFFPKEIFELVPGEKIDKACICKDCLQKIQ